MIIIKWGQIKLTIKWGQMKLTICWQRWAGPGYKLKTNQFHLTPLIKPLILFLFRRTMYTIEPGPFTLGCHPQTPSQEVREIVVVAGETTNGGLLLTFRLLGDITVLAIPGPRSPLSADNLWQLNC